MPSGAPPLPPPAAAGPQAKRRGVDGRGKGERPGLPPSSRVHLAGSRLLALLAVLALFAAACTSAVLPTASAVPTASVTAITPDTGTDTPGPTLDPAASPLPSAAATLTPSPTPDPSSTPVATPTGTPSVAPSGTPAGAPTACLQTQGQFTLADVPSRVLGYDIITRVYLPPCYAASSVAYPVLYLFHGLN